MPTQTTTTTVNASQNQSTPLVGVPSNEAHQQSIPEGNAGGEHADASRSDLLPEPNHQLSDKLKGEQEFDVDFYADEEEKIFDGEYHNEDHLLKAYWKILKQILETPSENRVKAYQNLRRRIGQLRPVPRYKPMHDALIQWAKDGYSGEPSIVFTDPNGEEYYEPKEEGDNYSKQRGHNQDRLQPSNEEIILPTDMEYFDTMYKNEATPLIEQIFDKPRLAQQEPGKMLDAINNKIKARVSEEQVRMIAGDKTLLINVDLQVPIRLLLHLMIRGTHELVNCGKTQVEEIQDKNTLSAYQMLEIRLNRAKQPILWHKSLGKLVEAKAERWREHTAANSDHTTDENLWDESFEAFVNTQAADPEYIKAYYDGRNAPEGLVDNRTNVPNNAQAEGGNLGNDASNEVDMPDVNHEEQTGNATDPAGNPESATSSNVSSDRQRQDGGTSKFADAIKIDCEPGHVLDGDQNRKIEGYLKSGFGHSLLIRMNEPEAVPAKCELTAAGPFGRSKLIEYQALSNARQIQRATDLAVLKTKSMSDLHCTFIATQRDTYSRTIVGGRFGDDDASVERHFFQSQLARVMGAASVDEWIKKIWPELYEENEDEVVPTESSPGAPPATPAQNKGSSVTTKQGKHRQTDGNQKAQLELMQQQMDMLMKQMAALQSSLGGGIQA